MMLTHEFGWALACCRRGSCIAISLLLVTLSLDVQLLKAEPKEPRRADRQQSFLRLATVDSRPRSLDTAIVSYVPVKPAHKKIQVDLIAAVHVGQRSYYEKLNELMRGYDAVLYEMVAERDVRPGPNERSSGSPLSWLQGGLTSILELEFQLDRIDYQRKNFVHADLSPREMAQHMKRRGETILGMVLDLMGQSLATQKEQVFESDDVALLTALFAPDRAIRLRRILARQLVESDGKIVLGGGNGSTLIDDRNDRALDVLSREIANGKKRIGIFYGAAHMHDFDEKLRKNFGLRRSKQNWLEAWALMEKSE